MEPMFCLTVVRHHENLVKVPDDIDPAVTTLDLSYNNIETIDATSLAAFEYLSVLHIQHNDLRYIEEGAFDNNRFLTTLEFAFNRIETMISHFAAAKHSLVKIQLWAALTAKATQHANFSECIKLKFLNIGADLYYNLDVSTIPRNLTHLVLNYLQLSEFPDLRYQT